MIEKLGFIAITAVLSFSTISAQELPEEIRNLYSKEQKQNQGLFELTPVTYFPEQNGVKRVDILVSCQKGDQWLFRNRFDRIFLRDGKIDAVKSLDSSNDFWSSALTAKKFVYIDSTDNGKQLLFRQPDGEPLDSAEIRLPESARNAMRISGTYLYPVSGGYPLRGITLETIEEYRKLSAKQEILWLQNRLQNQPSSQEAVELLKRLRVIGVFSAPMKAAERETWRQLLLSKKLGNGPRRFLQNLLFLENFLPHEEFAGELLRDPVLGKSTATEFITRNRAAFVELILRWSKDPEMQIWALHYSEELADNQSYRRQMLAIFRKPTPEQIPYMIPIYARNAPESGNQELKTLLKETSYAGNYRLLCMIAQWILKTRPAAYTPDIKNFLFRERNNPDLKRGILYPLLLASLCKAHDAEGTAAAIVYLETIKTPADIENAKLIWGKGMAGTVSIDRIIQKLKQK